MTEEETKKMELELEEKKKHEGEHAETPLAEAATEEVVVDAEEKKD
jgi:hypothetical protein